MARPSPGDKRRGWITLGSLRLPCAFGRSGPGYRKREGDGVTPIGVWRIELAFYRADRITRPRLAAPTRPLHHQDGWCDATGDRNYNRLVRLPYPASSEELLRDDRLYDIVMVLSHNRRPRIMGAGSAIFLHVARPDFGPTAGCVALRLADLQKLLALNPRAIRILPG